MLLTTVLSGVAAFTVVKLKRVDAKATTKTPLFLIKEAVFLALPRPKAQDALWVRAAQLGCAYFLRLRITKAYSTIAVKSIVITSSFAKVLTLTVKTFTPLASVAVPAPVKLIAALSNVF